MLISQTFISFTEGKDFKLCALHLVSYFYIEIQPRLRLAGIAVYVSDRSWPRTHVIELCLGVHFNKCWKEISRVSAMMLIMAYCFVNYLGELSRCGLAELWLKQWIAFPLTMLDPKQATCACQKWRSMREKLVEPLSMCARNVGKKNLLRLFRHDHTFLKFPIKGFWETLLHENESRLLKSLKKGV